MIHYILDTIDILSPPNIIERFGSGLGGTPRGLREKKIFVNLFHSDEKVFAIRKIEFSLLNYLHSLVFSYS